MITEEMVRIDVDLANDSAQSQLNHTPIVSRRPASSAFPSIHPFAAVGVFIGNKNSATRLEEILLLCKELIIRDYRAAAEACRCKVDKTGGRSGCLIRCGHAKKNPESQTPNTREIPSTKFQSVRTACLGA